MLPSGYGPWVVALLVHTGQGGSSSKRQTELRIETYPELLPWAHARCGQPGWALVMMVGIFTSWDAAVGFYQQWLQPTRGKTRRIQRGLELIGTWYKQYHLYAWIQSTPASEYTSSSGGGKSKTNGKRNNIMALEMNDLDERPLTMSTIESAQHLRNSAQKKRIKV